MTGTLIVHTYGYGTRLGYLKLSLAGAKVTGHEGRLMHVWSDQTQPDPKVVARLAPYRQQAKAAAVGEVVGFGHRARLVRDYRAESSLGSFVADVMRERSGAEIAVTNAGGLRADLPEGPVTRGDVLDALPFVNSLVTLELTGAQVREVLEQGLSLERGMVQVSGLRAVYDLDRPAGKRLVEVAVGAAPLQEGRAYRVATNSFLAQGGDLYQAFLRAKTLDDTKTLLSDLVIEHFRVKKQVAAPLIGSARTGRGPKALGRDRCRRTPSSP